MTAATITAPPTDLAALTVLAEALTDTERATVQARFPRLTIVDAVAVLTQHPDATDVRPYIGWLRAGRRVRHGEHGMVLPPRAPGTLRARVFDVDQTDPDDTPAAPAAINRATRLQPLEGGVKVTAPHVDPVTFTAVQQPLRLATSRYRGFQPSWGVPVRITVGYPRGVRYKCENVPALAPWELFRPPYKGINDIPVERLVYFRRMADHEEEILAQLARLAQQHPDERCVLLCYEDVNGGEACHRRWAAEWFQLRYGWDIPEIDPRNPNPDTTDRPAPMATEATLF